MKHNRDAADAIAEALRRPEADAEDPRLRTHKLRGSFSESRAASDAYDLRIAFSFGTDRDEPCIPLEAVGSHDEVY